MINVLFYGQQLVKLPGKVRKGLLVGLFCLLIILSYYNLRPFIGFVPDRPEDLEIVFRHGFGAMDVLDTREGTFTREMTEAPDITIPLKLTEREFDTVWAYIHRNHFYELEEQNPASASSVSPAETCVLFVHADGYPDTEVSMKDIMRDYTLSERRFFRITGKLKDIIESRPEYKALPKRGGEYA